MSTIERILRCLPRALPLPAPETLLADLALDSMDTVEFLCAVHAEFGVRLTEAQFYPQQTVAGLAAVLEKP